MAAIEAHAAAAQMELDFRFGLRQLAGADLLFE
ncbi:hypothetical protein ACVWZL_003070 [Bradyrhizobium sp. GM2.4]